MNVAFAVVAAVAQMGYFLLSLGLAARGKICCTAKIILNTTITTLILKKTSITSTSRNRYQH
jgi:hypothetical protein